MIHVDEYSETWDQCLSRYVNDAYYAHSAVYQLFGSDVPMSCHLPCAFLSAWIRTNEQRTKASLVCRHSNRDIRSAYAWNEQAER